MLYAHKHWPSIIVAALNYSYPDQLSGDDGLDPRDFSPEIPPKAEFGDIGYPMFALAKMLRKGPPHIAQGLVSTVESVTGTEPWLSQLDSETSEALLAGRLGTPVAAGPYFNVRVSRKHEAWYLSRLIHEKGEEYGSSSKYLGDKMFIEFSSPNTNKPLHLGHLRNNALGESMARIFRFCGAEVKKINLFNDRGIHICKSMEAYKRWGNGETPESSGVKGDHLVAKYYVMFEQKLKEEIDQLRTNVPEYKSLGKDELFPKTQLGRAAQAMLKGWEDGDPDIRTLWNTMGTWATEGISETYKRCGIHFDLIQYEHETYLLGKDQVLHGLEKGVFKKRDDGAVVMPLPEGSGEKEQNKVVLRSDGTSIYLTQDIGTAITRHDQWPFDRGIYVVASEQNYHFKMLFHALSLLGHPWAEKLHHLSYGMVNLPDGRMKSREGTIVDADHLLDDLRDSVLETMADKGRFSSEVEARAVAESIGFAALQYFLMGTASQKDITYNKEESLSFQGETGPYLLYVGARIASLLAKSEIDFASATPTAQAEEEWALVKTLSRFPDVVMACADEYSPAALCSYLYDVAKNFSRFYHELPVLKAETEELVRERLALCALTKQVMENGLRLLNIPFVENM